MNKYVIVSFLSCILAAQTLWPLGPPSSLSALQTALHKRYVQEAKQDPRVLDPDATAMDRLRFLEEEWSPLYIAPQKIDVFYHFEDLDASKRRDLEAEFAQMGGDLARVQGPDGQEFWIFRQKSFWSFAFPGKYDYAYYRTLEDFYHAYYHRNLGGHTSPLRTFALVDSADGRVWFTRVSRRGVWQSESLEEFDQGYWSLDALESDTSRQVLAVFCMTLLLFAETHSLPKGSEEFPRGQEILKDFRDVMAGEASFDEYIQLGRTCLEQNPWLWGFIPLLWKNPVSTIAELQGRLAFLPESVSLVEVEKFLRVQLPDLPLGLPVVGADFVQLTAGGTQIADQTDIDMSSHDIKEIYLFWQKQGIDPQVLEDLLEIDARLRHQDYLNPMIKIHSMYDSYIRNVISGSIDHSNLDLYEQFYDRLWSYYWQMFFKQLENPDTDISLFVQGIQMVYAEKNVNIVSNPLSVLLRRIEELPTNSVLAKQMLGFLKKNITFGKGDFRGKKVEELEGRLEKRFMLQLPDSQYEGELLKPFKTLINGKEIWFVFDTTHIDGESLEFRSQLHYLANHKQALVFQDGRVFESSDLSEAYGVLGIERTFHIFLIVHAILILRDGAGDIKNFVKDKYILDALRYLQCQYLRDPDNWSSFEQGYKLNPLLGEVFRQSDSFVSFSENLLKLQISPGELLRYFVSVLDRVILLERNKGRSVEFLEQIRDYQYDPRDMLSPSFLNPLYPYSIDEYREEGMIRTLEEMTQGYREMKRKHYKLAKVPWIVSVGPLHHSGLKAILEQRSFTWEEPEQPGFTFNFDKPIPNKDLGYLKDMVDRISRQA